MGQSLCGLYIHYIWSTKNRYPFISKALASELYPYSAEIINELECVPLEIGGVADHIHILVRQNKNLTIPRFVEKVKSRTSSWAKKQAHHDPLLRKFQWQGGYGAFSVSPFQVDAVRRSIQNQETHHQKQTFQDEFREFLRRYEIPYDERYVWGLARKVPALAGLTK